MTGLLRICVSVLMLSLAEHAQAGTAIRRSQSKAQSLTIESDGSINIKKAASAQEGSKAVIEAMKQDDLMHTGDFFFDTGMSRDGRHHRRGASPPSLPGYDVYRGLCATDGGDHPDGLERYQGQGLRATDLQARCDQNPQCTGIQMNGGDPCYWCALVFGNPNGGHGGSNHLCFAKRAPLDVPPTTLNTSTVTCPFLATLLNEGDLEKRTVHTAQELADVTVQAGLPNETVQGHVFDGNFRDIPSLRINLFDMEGDVNEHLTSTGITDCPSNYPVSGSATCPLDSVTQAPKCPTPNPGCRRNATFVQEKFDTFFRIADTDTDGVLDVDELLPAEEQYNNVLGDLLTADVNFGLHIQPPHSPEGRIHGAFTMLTEVFGEECRRISRATLHRIVVENRYPSHFAFPNLRNCP